ncbi:MAG: hypothetical protein KC609_07245, partial [Myxococcales bacterium]|nr:hypothetical protein [Myxococcales bacterium]
MNRLIARWAPICRRDSVEVERILASEDIWLVPIDGGAVSGASTDIVLLTACERCQCCPELIEQVRRAHPTARIYSITDQPLTGENRDLVDVEISGPDSLEQLRQSLREMRATLDRRRPPRREQHSLDASFSHQANERLHEAISALAELREQVGRFVGAGQPTIEITRSLDVLERSCAGLRRLLGYAESTDKTSRVMGENEANLADCVRRALTLAAPRIPYDVSIKTMLNQTPPVRGKEAWVGQLALGFVLLALDSVKADESRRGKIEIRTHFDSDQAMVVLEL